jgi:hypothetical protein
MAQPKRAAHALLISFVVGKSGGIVGRGGRLGSAGDGRLGGDAAFGLGLAALEVFPQRRRQAPFLPSLLGGLAAFAYLAAFAHETRLRPRASASKVPQ